MVFCLVSTCDPVPPASIYDKLFGHNARDYYAVYGSNDRICVLSMEDSKRDVEQHRVKVKQRAGQGVFGLRVADILLSVYHKQNSIYFSYDFCGRLGDIWNWSKLCAGRQNSKYTRDIDLCCSNQCRCIDGVFIWYEGSRSSVENPNRIPACNDCWNVYAFVHGIWANETTRPEGTSAIVVESYGEVKVS